MPKEGFCDHSPIGGATEEDLYCTADMGLTQADTTAITDGWRVMIDAVHAAIVGAGGFSWDQFVGVSTPAQSACAAFFDKACSPAQPWYGEPIYHSFTKTANGTFYPLPAFEQDLATFLLIRGTYAWLGYGWLGCSSGSEPPGAGGQPYSFPPALTLDYGAPTSNCSATAPGSGVYTREWSKATVQMDCNTWTPTITMK